MGGVGIGTSVGKLLDGCGSGMKEVGPMVGYLEVLSFASALSLSRLPTST